jgi:hypothetical protein
MSMLHLSKVVDDLYRLLGMEQPVNAPSFVADVATNAINAAVQDIFRETGEFFRFTTHSSVTFGGTGNNASKQSLNIQESTRVIEIIGPDEISRLRPLNRQQELDWYAPTFNPSAAIGHPEAFWLERTYGANPGAILHITPPALAQTALSLKVITTFEIPELDGALVANYSSNHETGAAALNAVILPIPMDWMETYLMPLARGHAMRSHYWILKDEAQMFSADYDKAIAMLKLLNPEPREDFDTQVDPQQGRS